MIKKVKTKIKLKPCPFCKNKYIRISRMIGRDSLRIRNGKMKLVFGYTFYCDQCECRGPISKSKTGAINIWQNRS